MRNHEPFDPEKVGLVGVLLFARWLTGLCIISGLSLLMMKWIPSIKSWVHIHMREIVLPT
jgi:hypothetical protein